MVMSCPGRAVFQVPTMASKRINSDKSDMLKTLIAGCGDVGTRLALRLSERDHEVWGIRRNGSELESPIRGIAADLGDLSLTLELPMDLDYVVYCAAAGRRDEETYRRTYVDGLRNLLNQLKLQKQNPRRIIFTSSTAVYHQTQGEWIDETSATQPTGFPGRILLEAETLLANSGFEYSIVRFAGIYGPGRDHFINQVKQGDIVVSDTQPQYTNRIHSDDCAGLLQHLLDSANPEKIYIGVDSDPAPRAEVADWLADVLNAPKPARSDNSSSPRGQNKRCRNTKVLESGYEFRYPTYREGFDRR